MIEIEAIDMFVEKDPESSDDDEGNSLISLRVPADREFSRQIKEMGAKWDDASKEWQIEGNETTVKQIGALCKAVFPELPRRKNRLVASQLTISETDAVPEGKLKRGAKAPPPELELLVRVEFLVNRTIKTYRRGQNLKWFKEFRQTVDKIPAGSAGKDNNTGSDVLNQYVTKLQSEIRELERSAGEAFEGLLVGRKDSVAAILKEAGIEQI